jgi:pre-rRNA-processing protein TSR1
MKVSGFLKGQPLSVNSLIHIPGWGDFQMEQIDLTSNDFIKSFTGKDVQTTVLEKANPKLQVFSIFLFIFFESLNKE